MRREQHIYAVEHMDARTYGYLVSHPALLHPKGENLMFLWDCAASSTR
jgi:hypothetical protein